MNVISRPEASQTEAPSDLAAALAARIGRYRDKTFDMDAFPSNRGYKELERGQMRFVGAGGSPKVGDSETFPPGSFTVSLIHQEPGRFAAGHKHEIEESFLVFDGVLTVGWEQGGDAVEVRLGPKDLIMNAMDIAHGFRNDDVKPILMSVMVGVGKPLPPVYTAHPKDTPLDRALKFGATRTLRLEQAGDHPLARLMAPQVVRYHDTTPIRDPGGFTRRVYVGAGAVPSRQNRLELITLAPGEGVQAYNRPVEDAYFVMEGTLTVGWEKDGATATRRVGARDLLLTPAGQPRWFRNDSASAVEFMMVIGTPAADDFIHRPV